MLDFYQVRETSHPRFFDCEVHPFPDDLEAVVLGPDLPKGLYVKAVCGREPGDLISAALWVFSKRFLDVLESCQATGYRACPIRIVDKKGHPLPDYFLLKLTGRGGPLDEERSGVIRGSSGAILGRTAVYMDESQWDGSDVFAIPGMGICMFVTQRIGEAIRKARLLNIDLVVNSEDSFMV